MEIKHILFVNPDLWRLGGEVAELAPNLLGEVHHRVVLPQVRRPFGHIVTRFTRELYALMHGCPMQSEHVSPRREIITMVTRVLAFFVRKLLVLSQSGFEASHMITLITGKGAV